MKDLGKILYAASFAAEKHRLQKRKDEIQPYINHPIEVANLLVNVGDIHDTDTVVAALLHDTVEDCDVTFSEIEGKFGPIVAGYVRELTDDKSLPKAERKQLQIEHAPHLTDGAKRIKLADKISNIDDIAKEPPKDWSIEQRREYIEWGENVVAGLRGVNGNLERLFDETCEFARQGISEDAAESPSTHASPSA